MLPKPQFQSFAKIIFLPLTFLQISASKLSFVLGTNASKYIRVFECRTYKDTIFVLIKKLNHLQFLIVIFSKKYSKQYKL